MVIFLQESIFLSFAFISGAVLLAKILFPKNNHIDKSQSNDAVSVTNFSSPSQQSTQPFIEVQPNTEKYSKPYSKELYAPQTINQRHYSQVSSNQINSVSSTTCDSYYTEKNVIFREPISVQELFQVATQAYNAGLQHNPSVITDILQCNQSEREANSKYNEAQLNLLGNTIRNASRNYSSKEKTTRILSSLIAITALGTTALHTGSSLYWKIPGVEVSAVGSSKNPKDDNQAKSSDNLRMVKTSQGGEVNLRQAPSQESPFLGTVPSSTFVKVLGEKHNDANEGWYKVQLKERVGWIRGDYLVKT
jgi:Bacterial SH3 domain